MFAEMMVYGREYTSQIVKNSRALAERLNEDGLKVLGEKKGFTKSHVIIADITAYGDGKLLRKNSRTRILFSTETYYHMM